jgi:uncharacterized phage protein (TIGR02218 family)
MAGGYQYSTSETSNHQSYEVQLYEFMRYGKTWFYAQADRDITIGGPPRPTPKTVNLRIVSAGFSWNGGNNAFADAMGVYDPQSGAKYAGWKHRSWHMGYIDPNGEFVFVDAYDNVQTGTPGATEADRLGTDLNHLDSGVTVIIWTGDEPQSNLTPGLRAALIRCGARGSTLDAIQYRSSYILVGVPGVGEGNGTERYAGQDATLFTPSGDPYAYTEVTLAVQTQPDPNVTYGITYKGVQISDDGIKISGPGADTLKVTMQADTEIAALFVGTPPSGNVWIRVRRWQWGSVEAPIAVYVGTITSADRPTPGSLVISCENIGSSFQANGLRLCWSRMCPHVLYDQNSCKVNKATYKITATIGLAAQGQLDCPEVGRLPDGWFDGGFVEWQIAQGVPERRGIDWHQGTKLSLLGFSDGFEGGQVIQVYAGCDRTILTCANKFNNADNYGGVPYLPGKSPYDGDPVF